MDGQADGRARANRRHVECGVAGAVAGPNGRPLIPSGARAAGVCCYAIVINKGQTNAQLNGRK